MKDFTDNLTNVITALDKAGDVFKHIDLSIEDFGHKTSNLVLQMVDLRMRQEYPTWMKDKSIMGIYERDNRYWVIVQDESGKHHQVRIPVI